MHKFKLSTAGVLWAAAVLAACEPRDPPQPKVAPEGSVAERAERKIDEMQAEAREELAEARDRLRTAGQELKAGSEQASGDLKRMGDQAAGKVADATITTTIKARLAQEPDLSATRIDVDTAQGKVALRGTAPSPILRDRATEIASAVSGVTQVDNQLTVGSQNL